MRVTVIHNPGAGDEMLTADALLTALHDAGYQPHYVSSKDVDLDRALRDPGELAVVAGGDGTVAAVAKRLAGRTVPIAVIAAGTANNIAASLGVKGALRHQIANWSKCGRQPFDVGTAEFDAMQVPFIESVGCGLFADMMAHFDRKKERKAMSGGPDEELQQAREELRKMLERARPREWNLQLDGENCSGRYVLVEAMNVPRIGPNLKLAPDARPGDGLLSVALVPQASRDLLDAHLRQTPSTSKPLPALNVRHAHRVSLNSNGARVHIDDDCWPQEGAPHPMGTIRLTLRPGAVTFLTPA